MLIYLFLVFMTYLVIMFPYVVCWRQNQREIKRMTKENVAQKCRNKFIKNGQPSHLKILFWLKLRQHIELTLLALLRKQLIQKEPFTKTIYFENTYTTYFLHYRNLSLCCVKKMIQQGRRRRKTQVQNIYYMPWRYVKIYM